MKITLNGAAKTVTGSCYNIMAGADQILVDCGMFQGGKETEALNYKSFDFDPKQIKALLLTHAHLDHCGRIPKIVKDGFKGVIYATAATRDLAFVIMMDSAKVALMDIKYENKRRAEQNLPPREPMYTEDDVKHAIKLFKIVKYHQSFGVTKCISATFYEAGHILGAASILLDVCEKNIKKTIVFSGDIGQLGTPIVRDLEYIKYADYVFVESTYGNRLHPPLIERRNIFLKIIHDTFNKRGKLMIPTFAIERAQEILYDLNEFAEKGLMPKNMPVYIDSPMAIKATEVFKKHPELYNKEVKSVVKNGDDPFNFPKLKYSHSVDDSIKIQKAKESSIIIAGSGMCTGGRIKHHIKNGIENPNNTILFVGYQVYGTLGYWIKKGKNNIRLLGKTKHVNATVESIDSFSGHADYKGLLTWLRSFEPKPKIVYITHGEEKTTIAFSKKVQELGLKTKIPSMQEVISI